MTAAGLATCECGTAKTREEFERGTMCKGCEGRPYVVCGAPREDGRTCGMHLSSASFAEGQCPMCFVDLDLDARSRASQIGYRKKKTGRTFGRDDVGGMLVDVARAAMIDERLTEVDRDVVRAIYARAYELNENEVTATERWLAATTGHTHWRCEAALHRLERFGYLRRIAPEEVRRQTMRNWLGGRTFKDGRLPNLYRLALNVPAWRNVPDYTSDVDVEAFNALLRA